jgi:hypothetical protein
MKKIQTYLSLALLCSIPAVYADTQVSEKVVDATDNVVRSVANAVEEGAHAVKEFVDSTTPKAKVALQHLEAKRSKKLANRAWRERETLQQETAEINKRIRLAKNEISELQAELAHSKEALSHAQQALYVREVVDPSRASETLVDKAEEAALATRNIVVGAATGTKDAVVNVASSVVEAVKSLPATAKYLAASTAVKTNAAVQEARAEHAVSKAHSALQEEVKAEQELEHLYRKRALLQDELAQTEYQKQLAHESLVQAQETAYLRKQLATQ